MIQQANTWDSIQAANATNHLGNTNLFATPKIRHPSEVSLEVLHDLPPLYILGRRMIPDPSTNEEYEKQNSCDKVWMSTLEIDTN